MERDFPDYKAKTKSILKSLSSHSESMIDIEAGYFTFHIFLAGGVAYVGLADKNYPKKLAYSLLSDLQKEFNAQYGAVVGSTVRPYAFIKFDSVIQKAKKSYQDVRAKQNLDRLHEELVDVTKIMTESINDVLERGGKLEKMSLLSSNLSQESRRYLQNTRHLNWMMLWRTYGPISIIVLGLILFIYVWFKFF